MTRDSTVDAFWGGSLSLRQPARGHGYRINVDALLLCREVASLAASGMFASAIDLGAGVGALGLSLLHLGLCARVTLVERDPFSASLSLENSLPFGDRVTSLHLDVTAMLDGPGQSAPLVVSNPPFFTPDEGPRSVEPSRADARTGHRLDFLRVARHVVAPDGIALWIYPAATLSELLVEAKSAGLHARSIRFVHPSPALPARVAMVAFALESSRIPHRVRPPWFERSSAGDDDPELRAFLRQTR